MKLDADVVVLGAGVAGLSLAYHLSSRGLRGRRVLLLEPRTGYGHDRTFCFWDVTEHAFAELASHRWSRWRVRSTTGPWIERSAPGLAYRQVSADAFYQAALNRIEHDSDTTLRLGVEALSVEDEGDHVSVRTPSGIVRAAVAFDSRPRSGPLDGITLLQHFEGWHVQTQSRVFAPAVATLMDFRASQADGIRFTYVLPYGPTEGLVEATWFGRRVLDHDTYRVAIERYLREELGLDDWTVVRRERGVIPMTTAAMPVRVSPRVYRIGLAGGLAKPSTGYAFQAIQRFSADLAARMQSTLLPDPPEPRDWRARTLDTVFLSYLDRYPAKAPAVFAQLFERVDPALLVRFLSDLASPADCVRVMAALPFAPFSLETLRSARHWLRQ